MSEPKKDDNYYFVVIVLLVIMMAAVAGLWVLEHKKVNRAVAFINKQQQQQSKQDNMLRDMIANAEVEKQHMLNRDRFLRKSVNVNGRDVDVFLVTRADGVKAGLMEGDIIFVGVDPSRDAQTATPANDTAVTENPTTE